MAKAAWLVAVGVMVLAASARGGGGATIEWMHDPHPDARSTDVWDVSAAGDIVVGYSARNFDDPNGLMLVPVYWDQQRTLQSLPLPTGIVEAIVTSVSDDGRVFGGIGDTEASSFSADVGIVWTRNSDGTIDLQVMPRMFIESMSTDGHIRVGSLFTAPRVPCVWHENGGLNVLPTPPEAGSTRALSVSDDGTIVGDAYGQSDLSIRWSTTGTYEVLDRTALWQSRSRGAGHITPSGGIIGGNGFSPVWTDDIGWHGAVYNEANEENPPPIGVTDSTPDGRFMVGADWSESCSPEPEDDYQGIAAVWDAYNGTRYLREVLYNEYGLDVDCLLHALGVSSDGRVIVGTGFDANGWERGFIITLPPPCTADTNADHLVNGADLSVILSAFGRQTPPGLGPDLNDDGIVNGSDLSILLFNFGDPC